MDHYLGRCHSNGNVHIVTIHNLIAINNYSTEHAAMSDATLMDAKHPTLAWMVDALSVPLPAPALTAGTSDNAYAEALMKADIKPSLMPCFSKNRSYGKAVGQEARLDGRQTSGLVWRQRPHLPCTVNAFA